MPLTPQQMMMLQQMQQAQQPPMPAPQAGQMPPPAAAGQMNPNVLAFMQQMQQRGGMGQRILARHGGTSSGWYASTGPATTPYG